MAGQYATTTLDQAVLAVANRLGDPNQVRWTGAELRFYVQDAIRVWGALTATFRSTLTFNTSDPALNSNAPFWDLGTVAPGLRGLTVTFEDLMHRIQYMLLEPLSVGLVWSGSAQFTFADVRDALTRRRDQFLLDTAAILTRSLIPVLPPPPDGRIALDETVITVRRLAWVTPEGTVRPIQRDDEWSANSYSPAWPQQSRRVPRMYSVAAISPLWLQLMPPPNDSGALDLTAVYRGVPMTATSTLIGVPDDWAWVILFGALADLLGRDGLALDPARAAYCRARWQHGVDLAKQAAVILTGRLNNVPCRVGSIPDADQFKPGWQTPVGPPLTVMTIGQNLLALAPAPDVNAPSGHAVTLDVVRNSPIPLNGAAYVPIGPEVLDSVYDYAQHLALFKEGPTELATAQSLLDRFFRAAGEYVSWQAALQPQRAAMLGQQSQDKRGASQTRIPTDDVQAGAAPGVTV